MTPPSTVKVNGRVVAIKYRAAKHMPDAAGLFHPTRHLIEISKGQDSQEVRDTVLHETLHALLYTQGREYGGDEEETYVRAIATGLIGVLQDNREFSQWLIQHPDTPP